MADSELKAPVMLLAMPQVLDPFFHRSVVLLVAHDEEGSFGFIVNRSTEIRIADILQGMELEWRGDGAAFAHFGGPVQPQLGTVLYSVSSPAAASEEVPAVVFPGVAISQQVDDLARLAAAPPLELRLFLGYAGWGAGQLVDEILRNDWLTAPVSSDLLFTVAPERVWEKAVQSLGLDPAALPAWTAMDAGEESN